MPQNEGLLRRIIRALELAWEDFIYDPTSSIVTLFEIDNINGKYLQYLAPLLGFTRDLRYSPSEEEHRRILSNAVPYWNDKPAEAGVISDAIRMVTGNRFSVRNYRDLRSQVDVTCITEELQDVDPGLIGFPTGVYSGSQLRYMSALGGSAGEFRVDDLPFAAFKLQHELRWLVVTDATQPFNDAIYEIDHLDVGTTTGWIKAGLFPFPHTGTASWQLVGYAGEYTTEVRLVDRGRCTLSFRDEINPFSAGQRVDCPRTGAHGVIVSVTSDGSTGTMDVRSVYGRFGLNELLSSATGAATITKVEGLLNRDLLLFLMDTPRPPSERIDIVYVDFIDSFTVPTDLDQWDLAPDTDGVTVPSPGGAAAFEAGYSAIDNDSEHAYWGDQSTAWRIVPGTDATIVDLLFLMQDASNCYLVRVDYSAKTARLYVKVADVDTAIGAAVLIPYVKAGVQDVVRVEALADGSDTRIRVKINGALEIEQVDSPATYAAGAVGASANASTFELDYVEVNVLPTEIQRCGPLP